MFVLMFLVPTIILSSLFALWLLLGNRLKPDRYGTFLSVRRIAGPDQQDYLVRRYLLPRNRFMNIYLHHFLGSDDARALHDHPWYSASIVLKGHLIEHLPNKKHRVIRRGRITIRSPQFLHRIELPEQQTAVTLFCTGPVLRTWGFACPDGWVSWRKFEKDGGCE